MAKKYIERYHSFCKSLESLENAKERNLMKKLKDNKKYCRKTSGFTLAELLIVVAIVGVLVAVSIPVFSSQLEKSREATDLANVRSAYAQVMAEAITDDSKDDISIKVPLKQKNEYWDISKNNLNIGGIAEGSNYWVGDPIPGSACNVTFQKDLNKVVLRWSGSTLRTNYQWKIGTDNTISISAGSYDDKKWPCSAITDYLYAKNDKDSTIEFKGITDSSQKLKVGMDAGFSYQVGYFLVDENDNIIVDSGRQKINGDNSVKFSLCVDNYKEHKEYKEYVEKIGEVDQGKNLKVAIQVFKVNLDQNGSEPLTSEEALELEKLIAVHSK